jgi:hypothetical protein
VAKLSHPKDDSVEVLRWRTVHGLFWTLVKWDAYYGIQVQWVINFEITHCSNAFVVFGLPGSN